MEFKEKDEVYISFKDASGWVGIWATVMFKDTNETFIGKITRVDRRTEGYKKGQDYRFENSDVKDIYNGQQICYSDNVSVCDCPGLCRDK